MLETRTSQRDLTIGTDNKYSSVEKVNMFNMNMIGKTEKASMIVWYHSAALMRSGFKSKEQCCAYLKLTVNKGDASTDFKTAEDQRSRGEWREKNIEIKNYN